MSNDRKNNTSKVRLGIIGLGGQGSFYASLLTGKQINPDGVQKNTEVFEQIEVGAFCDTDLEKVERTRAVFPDIPVYTDYIEMLDSGNVDAIVTAVPHYLHPIMGIEAMNRGIHALLEKPAGVYSKQVQEVIDVANTKPELTFAIMFNQRTNPLYMKIKELIEGGVIGNIRRFNWIITTWYRPQAYYDLSAWRATWEGEGGGVLVNQVPHQIDMMQWLCGMPVKVTSKLSFGYARDIRVEDEVTAMFEFENGASGVLITCTHDPSGTDRLEIAGDKGKIIVENSTDAKLITYETSEQELNASIKDAKTVFTFMAGGGIKAIAPNYITESPIEIEATVWGGQHAEVLKNFAANIIDKTPLIAPGADGINGVRIANAIHLSSWLGKEVSLPLDDDLYYEQLQARITEEQAENAK